MTTPDEFGKKATLTIGMLVWIAGISFSMGVLYARINDHTKDIAGAREYVDQEVGGLRSDWERDRAMQNKRLDRLEDVD